MPVTPLQPAYRWPEDDKLNRKMDTDILLRFIEGKLKQRAKAGLPRSYVLNLDSQWGSGKTFFLKNLKDQIAANGQISVYVDAWQDDHSDDPFIAVVSAIEAELNRVIQNNTPYSGMKNATLPVAKSALKIIGSSAKSGLVHYAKKKIGAEAMEGMAELFDGGGDSVDTKASEEAISKATDAAVDATGKALLSGFATAKQARASFRENLENLTKKLAELDTKSVPVFVLIDELDRCRPSYAVKLLEEVKHLFYVENMVFIFGTDTEQLAHAVNGVYGSGFDGRRYLSRFIDRTYRFRKTDIRSFVEYSLHMHGLSEANLGVPDELGVVDFLGRAFEHANASLRYIEQIIDYIATFVATWEYDGLKINLILLFDLAVRAHPESKRLENGKYLALGTPYDFRRYKQGNIISLDIERMVDQIKDWSTNFQRRYSPENGFDDWVFNLLYAEDRALKSLTPHHMPNEIGGIAQKYPRMFHDMLGVHDVFTGD